MEFKQELAERIRAQFGRPTGLWGGLAGWVMAHRASNRRRSAWAVSLLEVERADRVLEIGFGPGVAIVGQASTGREAVHRARRADADVVLMDVRMPDLDGIGATRELTRVAPRTRVLILTTFEQDDYIFGALRADLADQTKLRELTAREREVLALVARGLPNREIARVLVVEESTIRTHVSRILTKLELHDRIQLVIFAYETGMNRPAADSLTGSSGSRHE